MAINNLFLAITSVALIFFCSTLHTFTVGASHAAVAGAESRVAIGRTRLHRVVDEDDLLLEYDKRQAPTHVRTKEGTLVPGRGPVNISTSVHIRVARWLPEGGGTLDTRFFLLQRWHDERLRFTPASMADGSVLDVLRVRSPNSLWTPSTLVPDALWYNEQGPPDIRVHGDTATVSTATLMGTKTPCVLHAQDVAKSVSVACELTFTSLQGANELHYWLDDQPSTENDTAISWAKFAPLVNAEMKHGYIVSGFHFRIFTLLIGICVN